jgi:hypothetical protein
VLVIHDAIDPLWRPEYKKFEEFIKEMEGIEHDVNTNSVNGMAIIQKK